MVCRYDAQRIWKTLRGHVPKPFLRLVIDGVLHGTNRGYFGPRIKYYPTGYKSRGRRETKFIREEVQGYIDKGIFKGWFKKLPFRNARVSPIFTTEKGRSFRLIVDMTRGGINKNISPSTPAYGYNTFSQVLKRLREKGWKVVPITFDVEAAYPTVPVRRKDWHLMCIYGPGKGFAFSVRLVFGCRASSAIWERMGHTLCLILHFGGGLKWEDMFRWVDDYVYLADAGKERETFRTISEKAVEHGFILKAKKSKVRADGFFEWYGVRVDTRKREATIPGKRRKKYQRYIQELEEKKEWSFRDMQRLQGINNCLAVVIPHLQNFSKRVKCAMKTWRKKGKAKKEEIKRIREALPWWGKAIEGKVPARQLQEDHGEWDHILEIDASPNGIAWWEEDTGRAGVFTLEKEHKEMAKAKEKPNSCILEGYAMLAAITSFPEASGKKIKIITDNLNLARLVQGRYRTSRGKQEEMIMMIWMAALQGKVELEAEWRSRIHNTVADSLSRQDAQAARRAAHGRGRSCHISRLIPCSLRHLDWWKRPRSCWRTLTPWEPRRHMGHQSGFTRK